MYRQYKADTAHLVEGEPMVRTLNGLEGFFRSGGYHLPPRWKMAIVTYLGVVPSVIDRSAFIGCEVIEELRLRMNVEQPIKDVYLGIIIEGDVVVVTAFQRKDLGPTTTWRLCIQDIPQSFGDYCAAFGNDRGVRHVTKEEQLLGC